jgi:hypothetical protein
MKHISNPGRLRLWHWLSDVLATQLYLIHKPISLILLGYISMDYRTMAIGLKFFSAFEQSDYQISYWQIQETIGLLDIGSRPQSIGYRTQKNYWLPTSAFILLYFAAFEQSEYQISYWQIQKIIGLLDIGSRPQSIGYRTQKIYWLPTSAFILLYFAAITKAGKFHLRSGTTATATE